MFDMVTHAQLTRLINTLYEIDTDGVCHGVACMTLQAFFLKDIDHFTKRLEILEKLIRTAESAGITLEELANGFNYRYDDAKNSRPRRKLDRAPDFWEGLKNYLGPSQCSTNPIQSEANKENWDKLRVDILAFLDGVSLNFNTRNYPEIFPEDTKLGQNPELSLSVTYPADNQLTPDQDPELSMPDSPFVQNFPSRTALFSGVYSRPELISYFNTLNKLMQQTSDPTGFMLGSFNHAIALGYEPAKQQWLLFDSNKLPFVVIENGEQFAAEIMSSFFEEGQYACFAMECYQTSEHSLTEENFNSTPEWLDLHEVTTDRADFKARDNMSWLYIAIKKGDVEVVRALLAKGADPNQVTSKGVTPLYIAVERGHVEIVRALLEDSRIKPNEPDVEGFTPIYIAVEIGFVEVVKVLLENGVVPNQTCRGVTPLYIAVERGYVEIVRALLAKGADPNQAYKGFTPLYIAAKNGHVEIVRALLANGADLNQTCKGFTPLYIAAKKGHVDVVEVLLRNEAVRTFIREKVHEPSGIELLKMLSTCGIDGPTLCELLLFVEPNREACLSLLEQMPLSEHIARDLVVKGILDAKEAEANERTFNDLKTAVLQACDRYNEVIGDLHEGTFFGGLFDSHQSEERRYVVKLQQDLDDGLITNIEQLRERITSIGERADWSIANDVFSEINPSGVEIQSPQPQEESPCTP